MATRILLADDHIVVRQGLRHLLDDQPDMQVVGEVGDGTSAVRLARELSPDVVIMDVAMPGLSGVDATREITSVAPAPRVVALTMYTERKFIAAMLEAGARAYVQKGAPFEEVALAVRVVVSGHLYLSDVIAAIMAQTCDDRGDLLDRYRRLTPRERQTFILLVNGKSHKEIALELGISIKTVSTFRLQTMRKLGVKTLPDLVKIAIALGLTTAEARQ